MESKEYPGDAFRSIWRRGQRFEYFSDGKWCLQLIDITPGFCGNTRYRLYTENKPDKVNNPVTKPNHYYLTVKLPEGGAAEIDCFSVSDALEFHKHHYIASAFAYVWRCLKKNNTVEDLKKAVVNLNKEIDLREQVKL